MSNLTGHEKIAARNIKGAFNWIIGENYNSYQDDCLDNISNMTAEEWKDYIYDEAMNNNYSSDGMMAIGKAPKEMRFAGEKFCRDYIDKLWNKDEDVKELQSVGKMLPAKQKSPKKEENSSDEEKVNYTKKTLEELKQIANMNNILFKEYSDEKITRMRLVMALKKNM